MRALSAAAMCVSAAAFFGCAWNEQKAAKPEEAEPVLSAGRAEPAPTDAPEKWIQGKVFRVWPFANGELMAYLGTENGVHNGDTLALQREGVTINTIEVLDAHEDIFYGRVVRRDDEAVMAKEGDLAVKVPASELKIFFPPSKRKK